MQRVIRIWAAVLGVLVLVLGPLATHHHLAAQAHAVCEHGAEIHVDAPGVHPAADATGVTAVREGQAPPDAGHGDHHHHCTATGGVAATVTAQPTVAIATMVAGEVPPPAAAPAVHAGAALFRLAPKTSPPV